MTKNVGPADVFAIPQKVMPMLVDTALRIITLPFNTVRSVAVNSLWAS